MRSDRTLSPKPRFAIGVQTRRVKSGYGRRTVRKLCRATRCAPRGWRASVMGPTFREVGRCRNFFHQAAFRNFEISGQRVKVQRLAVDGHFATRTARLGPKRTRIHRTPWRRMRSSRCVMGDTRFRVTPGYTTLATSSLFSVDSHLISYFCASHLSFRVLDRGLGAYFFPLTSPLPPPCLSPHPHLKQLPGDDGQEALRHGQVHGGRVGR